VCDSLGVLCVIPGECCVIFCGGAVCDSLRVLCVIPGGPPESSQVALRKSRTRAWELEDPFRECPDSGQEAPGPYPGVPRPRSGSSRRGPEAPGTGSGAPRSASAGPSPAAPCGKAKGPHHRPDTVRELPCLEVGYSVRAWEWVCMV
jgi:hypothetical protein